MLCVLNGKKLLSKSVTIPVSDQTIAAGSWLRLVGPGGIYESYDLLTASEISQGYKVMMVGNGSLRGTGSAINHIIPTFFILTIRQSVSAVWSTHIRRLMQRLRRSSYRSWPIQRDLDSSYAGHATYFGNRSPVYDKIQVFGCIPFRMCPFQHHG